MEVRLNGGMLENISEMTDRYFCKGLAGRSYYLLSFRKRVYAFHLDLHILGHLLTIFRVKEYGLILSVAYTLS